MNPPFIVFSLPRSRSFWLSRFLTYGEWTCGHDEIRHVRSLTDVASWFAQPNTGTVETLGAPWWRLVRDRFPAVRIVTLRRPVSAVVDSLARRGFDPAVMAVAMARMDRKLDQIERRVPGVLSIRSADLDGEAACAAVFEHCLPYRHDPAWWSATAALNLQVNMPAVVRYCAAHMPQLEKAASLARQAMLSGLARRERPSMDGVSFGVEPIEAVMRDGRALFRGHIAAIGESPDGFDGVNVPQLLEMERGGAVQITTARSNGRLFGYLMAVVCPSSERVGVLSAVHTIFHASPDMPGLGRRLQKASIARLRERGVNEVFQRVGVRGDGPRLGAMYSRMGAADHGHLYRLDLGAN